MISYERFRENVIKTLTSGFYVYGDEIIATYIGSPGSGGEAPPFRPYAEYCISYEFDEVVGWLRSPNDWSSGNGCKYDTKETKFKENKSKLSKGTTKKFNTEDMIRFLYENNKEFPEAKVKEWNQ